MQKICIVMFLATNAVAAWTAPIGIPDPNFGITDDTAGPIRHFMSRNQERMRMDGLQNKMRTIILIFFVLLMASSAMAVTIYVDNDPGNDCVGTYSVANRNNTGSETSYDTIQEAIDVVASGDTIYIRAGTYKPSTYINITSKSGADADHPITMSAYSDETVIVDGNSTTPSESAGLIWLNGSNYFHIQNLTIKNFYNGIKPYNCDYLVIQNCTVQDCDKVGMYIFQCDHSVISYNTVHDIVDNGIDLRACSYCTVDRNEVYTSLIGIHIYWRDSTYEVSLYNTISNNISRGNNVDAEDSDGIGIGTGTRYNLVTGNLVYNNADDGIDASTGQAYGSPEFEGYPSGYCLFNTVSSNICFKNGDGEGDGDGNGIKLSVNYGGGNVAAYNISIDNDENGILLAGPDGLPCNYAYNNTVYHNGYGADAGANNKGIFVDSGRIDPDERAILYNNISMDSLDYDVKTSTSNAIQESNNNFWADGNFLDGFDADSLSGDPKFANATTEINTTFPEGYTIDQKLEFIRSQAETNFALLSDSTAIDAGKIIEGFHNPTSGESGGLHVWYGDAPDIGAYESDFGGEGGARYLMARKN